jgi:hypothetical protein
MAKIQAYKFVNPGISNAASPKARAAAKHTLAVNRIGSTVEGIANVVTDLVSINKATLAFQKRVERTKKLNLRRERDAAAEERQEQASLKLKSQQKRKAEKDKKKLKLDKPKDNPFMEWAEKTFAPLRDFFIAIVGISIIKKYNDIRNDPEQQKEWEDFWYKTKFVFGKIYDFATGAFKSVMEGWEKLFGSDDEKSFFDRIEGLGDIIKGIAGFAVLGFFLNPMGLVNLVLTGIDFMLDGGDDGGGDPDLDGPNRKTPTKTDAQLKKMGLNDDQIKQYRKLRQSGESAETALKAARNFKPRPNIFQRSANALGGAIQSTFGKLRQAAEATWGLTSDWAKNQYASLSEAARKQWEKFANLSKKLKKQAKSIATKVGGALSSAKDYVGKGINSVGDKLKNFAMERILTPIQEFVKPLLAKVKSIASKMIAPLFNNPLGKKILEALKKKGISGAGDFVGIAKNVGGKALPIVGGLVNLLFAYERFAGGDPFGGLLESLSAGFDLAGIIPGGQFGPPISMGIDAYMFARDLIPGVQEFEESMINKIPGAKAVGDFMKKLAEPLPKNLIQSIIGALGGGGNEELPEKAAGGKVALYAGHADMKTDGSAGTQYGTSGGAIRGTMSTAPTQSYAKGYQSNEAYFNDKIAQKAAAKSGGLAMYRKPVRVGPGTDPNSNYSRIDKDNAAGITTVEIHMDAPKPMGRRGMIGINPDMKTRGANNGFLKALNTAYGVHTTQKGLGSVNRNNLSGLLEVAPLGWNVLRNHNSFIETESSKIANALKLGAKGKVPEVTGDPNAGDVSGDYTGDDYSGGGDSSMGGPPPPPPPPPDPMSALRNLQTSLLDAFGVKQEEKEEKTPTPADMFKMAAEGDLKGFSSGIELSKFDFSKEFAMQNEEANMIPFAVAIQMPVPITVPRTINTGGDEVVNVRKSPFVDK